MAKKRGADLKNVELNSSKHPQNLPPPRESRGPGDGGRLREACAAHRRRRRRLAGDRLYPRQARLQVATTTPRPRARRRMLDPIPTFPLIARF